MSQKVHASGFRLGVTQPSNTKLQCYGQISHGYLPLALKIQKVQSFLERILSKYSICIGNLECVLKDLNSLLHVVYVSSEKSTVTKKVTKFNWISKVGFKKNSKIVQLIPYSVLTMWMKNFVSVRFYRVHWLYNPKTLASWVSTQFSYQQPLKTILKLLKKELALSKQWNCETKAFISGSTKFNLIGIKLICRGRLRGKRQRMKTQVSKQLGVMPLQTLAGFVEYEKTSLCTRFGKIGIHVYYYYSKINNDTLINLP